MYIFFFDMLNQNYKKRLLPTNHLKEYRYDESYWTDLEAYCETEDIS